MENVVTAVSTSGVPVQKVFIGGGADGLGCLWFIGWIFTIGYLKLTFWKGVLALIIWPYYLGRHFSKVA